MSFYKLQWFPSQLGTTELQLKYQILLFTLFVFQAEALWEARDVPLGEDTPGGPSHC